MIWKTGDRINHRFNPDLGPGLVESIEGRTIVVRFPQTDTSLRLAADTDAIERLELRAGSRAMIVADGETVLVEAVDEGGRVRLSDGRMVHETEVWPLPSAPSLVDRLAGGDIDATEEFSMRLDVLHLAATREADGLGSFLGGRIRLFPHQLYAAERATRADPVRWLLADEVGLGKTVEACLVLNHLLHTGRADRALVVAPDTLTVQWLGELWRKYHQVFVLLDEARLGDVERDYGAGFNPFETHRRFVVGLEFLRDRPRLTEQAVAAGIDLLIVDEAHRLRRPIGHPGNRAYRAVAPIAARGRHVLLLTATPLEEDALGFFRLLQLLRPEEFPEDATIDARIAADKPLPPCTSATRRVDVGGLPPREPRRIDLADRDWADHDDLVARMRGLEASGPLARKAKLRKIRRALASGAALAPLLDASDGKAVDVARRATRNDPRIAWLVEQAPGWRRDGDKTLVFVAQRETLEAIKSAMSREAQIRVGVFHEDLSPGQRDIEVAQFRLSGGPSMLVSTECGGEGRNFEFCTRLVLFDMPWSPMTVEQRIGRLDRIGRRHPVEILIPHAPTGLAAAIVALYDALGLFRRPMAGLEPELAGVEQAIEEAALGAETTPDLAAFADLVNRADAAYGRIERAAQHELHRDPFRPEMAAGILARVPEELEELTRDIVLGFCERFDLHVEEHRGGSRHSIEFGHRALVNTLPGVAPGASWLGSFDREVAVTDEGLDFFASGHPLVEGILAHIEEAPLGRVALLHAQAAAGESGFGLLALYKRGPRFEALAYDTTGRTRPDWAERFTRTPLRTRRVKPESWTTRPGWAETIRKLAAHLDSDERPVALAAIRLDQPAG
jgi:ATP-dependent helicase HepA